MSFIDMYADTVWSEADITRKTEAMIFSRFPPETENIMNRKATGAALGLYVPTPEEQVQLAEYTAIANAAREAGQQARESMAILVKVMEVEAAIRRVSQVLKPVTLKSPVYDSSGSPVWVMTELTVETNLQAVDENGDLVFDALGNPVWVRETVFDDEGNPVMTELLDEIGMPVQETTDLGVVINQAELDLDAAERMTAQSIIDSASAEVMQWVDSRKQKSV